MADMLLALAVVVALGRGGGRGPWYIVVGAILLAAVARFFLRRR